MNWGSSSREVAVKAFVHAGALDLGEARSALFDQRDGNFIVGGCGIDILLSHTSILPTMVPDRCRQLCR
jgi:hypothetical protein